MNELQQAVAPFLTGSGGMEGSWNPQPDPSGGDSIIPTIAPGEGEASSSVQNPIQQPPHGAQEMPQDLLWNALEQPLIEEKERTLQLRAKLENRFHGENLTFPKTWRFEQWVQTHVNVEIEVEKRLRMEGYLPREINHSRAEIRELILYNRNGNPVKESILRGYLSELQGDYQNSTPFRIIKKARDNLNLSLYKPGDLFYKED
jgi:hypothetical protein